MLLPVSRRFVSSRLARTAVTALLAVAVGCKKTPVAAPVPGSMQIVQGDLQMAQAGLELPNVIIIRLLDSDGKPLEKFPIGFSIARGGGTVTPGSGLSDGNGEVKTKWTLGPNDMQQALRVNAGTLEPLNLSALGLLPSDLIVAQGSNQTAKAGAALPNAIVVRVVSQNNVPMRGIPVAFQISNGGGLISPQSGVTNASGEVQTRWTLGATAGVNALTIVAGSLQSVTITALGS